MRAGLLLTLFFCGYFIQAQTMERWRNLVKWDGVTPWQKYIIYSPQHMGPNALPVPAMGDGSIDSLNSFSVIGAAHFCKGDFTQNVKLSANYCLVKDVISFDLSWIPIELYRMSPELKDERHVYYQHYNDKTAEGDMYLNTNIQFLNKLRKDIHLALRIGYRFPTSTKLASARYTDAPGYHFDISSAMFLSQNKQWKFTSMIGFYVWQLNDFGQDDAFLFGGGIEYHHQNWYCQLNCRGYSGYRHNGDDPIIMSVESEKTFKDFVLTFNVRQGMHNYAYTSIELGTKLRLNPKKK